MTITLCDRCGKITKNRANLFVPITNSAREINSIQYQSQWFNPIILCNDCLKDLDNFRWKHEHFNIDMTKEE